MQEEPAATSPEGPAWGVQTPQAGAPVENASKMPAAPLSFTEAEQKKHMRKLQEFKQYLVETCVVQVLVELLSNMKESEQLPDDPQQALIDYFGEYRDPILDVIDELMARKETLKVEKAQMEEQLESLGITLEALREQSRQKKLWKIIAKTAPAVSSLALYQKLCDRKKPKGPLKNFAFTPDLFCCLLSSLPHGMTEQILQHLCPTGDPAECLSSANLKDDGENLILNAVITAINQFQPKEA